MIKDSVCQLRVYASSSLQSTQNEKLWAYAKYLYDALGQRTRFYELGKYNNQSFTVDVLLLYREVRGPDQP